MLLFSFVVAGATVFYAKLTHELVAETRRLREAQSAPHVSVRIEGTPTAFGFTDIVVENVGLGPAYDVSFEVECDLDLDRGRKLSGIGFIKNGVKYLAPKQRLASFLISLFEVQDTKMEGPDRLQFALTVNYRDAAGKALKERYAADFAHFVGMHRLGTPAIESIAESMKKLKDDIGKIGSGWSKITVVRLTPEDLAQERKGRELQRLERKLEQEGLEAPLPPGGGAGQRVD